MDEPSAFGQAVLVGLDIDSVERQLQSLGQALKQLRRTQRNWQTGARGEQSVVQVLVGMDDAGWHVLPDRRWPGTRRANIDVLLVGSGGVFVVEVKTWRDVRIEDGRLWRGDADAGDALDKLLAQTAAVEQVVADAGLPPTEVVPLLVLTGRRNTRAQLDRVSVLGEYDLTADLIRRGVRLQPAQVEEVLACLDQGCPPMLPSTGIPVAPSTPAARQRGGPAERRPAEQVPGSASVSPAPDESESALLSRDEVWNALVEAAAREPIESWMTWLDPTQARQVARRYSGPARVRGAAGTGKTVLALHRAGYLAANGSRVLFASHMGALSRVNQALLQRMTPDHSHRIEFVTVHALASRMLREAGLNRQYQQDVADTCFWRAWGKVGRSSALEELGVRPKYWQDEVATVIKGRGLTSFEEYGALRRVGRTNSLHPAQREVVWNLYECYERLRGEQGVLDRDDVLLLVRDLVRQKTDTGFESVIVDEVQDLTCAGLQLLHAFVGDKPDGLFIVGDGQQSVYPGGFTLVEAGISVVGRSTVLQRNYRNREAILQYAMAVVADDDFDDLDSLPERGHRTVHAARPGGEIHQSTYWDPTSQEMALGAHLRHMHTDQNVRFGDIAVLAPTNKSARSWQRILSKAGIPVVPLADYDGNPCDAVKVGTFHLAKGLDFAHVCIPDRNAFPTPPAPSESPGAYRERAELERRQMYVAITRARDSLWVGIKN